MEKITDKKIDEKVLKDKQDALNIKKDQSTGKVIMQG